MCCGVLFCNLPNLCLRTAFLEICTTSEPWVCSSNTSPISLPRDAPTPLHSTRCLVCQLQENWQLRPMLLPSGFDKAQNLSDQWPFLHVQLSQFSLLHNVVCFVSHFILVLYGHWDFQRRQIGCSCFADDCFCVFPICLMGDPDSIVPTDFSIQYLHLLRHSWFFPQVL